MRFPEIHRHGTAAVARVKNSCWLLIVAPDMLYELAIQAVQRLNAVARDWIEEDSADLIGHIRFIDQVEPDHILTIAQLYCQRRPHLKQLLAPLSAGPHSDIRFQ